MSGETEQNISGWTVDTLHSHVLALLGDLREFVNERALLERRAVEVAFAAQQAALEAAFTGSEKAVHAALQAQKEAVDKAEAASEKRFASVNEFRAQLSDQAATFAARSEVDVRFNALTEKFDNLTAMNRDRIATLELSLRTQLDTAAGQNAGETAAMQNRRALTNQLVGGLSLLVFVISVTLSIIVATRK